jgi:hypothetical protein
MGRAAIHSFVAHNAIGVMQKLRYLRQIIEATGDTNGGPISDPPGIWTRDGDSVHKVGERTYVVVRTGERLKSYDPNAA